MDYAKRLGFDGFYATAPGTKAREAEERIAREHNLKLCELKQVEAAGLGMRGDQPEDPER